MSFASDNAYSHCKSCDNKFYPHWVDEIKPCGTRVTGFEELCWKCLSVAMVSARTDVDLYKTSHKKWDEVSDYDMDILSESYTEDELSSLHSQDEYLKHGENAFGNFGDMIGLDRY